MKLSNISKMTTKELYHEQLVNGSNYLIGTPHFGYLKYYQFQFEMFLIVMCQSN